MPAPRLPARFRAPRGILATFGLLSIATIAILGTGLWQFLDRQIRASTVTEVGRSTHLLGHTAIAPNLPAAEVDVGRLSAASLTRIDQVLAEGRRTGDIESLVIWRRDGVPLYPPGVRAPLPDRLASALARDAAIQLNEVEGVKRFVALAPIELDGSGNVAAVAQVSLPYPPFEAAIATQRRRTGFGILGALGLLYLVLVPIVWRASRRLRRQSEANHHQSLHDALTGLPNRTLLHDRISQAVRADLRENTSTAVLLLDFDRFKEVNDTLGHATGDLLLQGVAQRLLDRLRGGDTLARLGGDEFAVVVSGQRGMAGPLRVAEDLRASLVEPFELNGIPVGVDVSIGIAVSPAHGEDPDTLIRRADVAMYAAKATRVGVAVYDPDQDTYSPEHLTLVDDLRRAIAGGDLRLHYQPKLEVSTGVVTGVEALARWTHPERGEISPGTFIPLAEHTGLIRPLTTWVLEEAMRQARRWRDAGRDLTVAINLSALTLLDDRLVSEVRAALDRTGVPATALEIEITETAVMTDPKRAVEILGEIHALGIRIAIDDFGTGYSCLAHLKRLPIDDIKIDRSFVMGMVGDPENEAIVRSTVDLGRNLGLRVVAEGVETVEALAELSDLGCDVAQGYLFSQPIPAAEIEPWIDARVASERALATASTA